MNVDECDTQEPADAPPEATIKAVREACHEKLDRAVTPTTTVTAKILARDLLDGEYQATVVGSAMIAMIERHDIETNGLSITYERVGGGHRNRYRLTEAGT